MCTGFVWIKLPWSEWGMCGEWGEGRGRKHWEKEVSLCGSDQEGMEGETEHFNQIYTALSL